MSMLPCRPRHRSEVIDRRGTPAPAARAAHRSRAAGPGRPGHVDRHLRARRSIESAVVGRRRAARRQRAGSVDSGGSGTRPCRRSCCRHARSPISWPRRSPRVAREVQAATTRLCRRVAPEARLEQTEAGLVPASAGWFVMNARDARWIEKPRQGHSLPLTGVDEYEAETFFPMLGMAIRAEPMGLCALPAGDTARFRRGR
jgi:hypothetical protein